MEEAYEVGIRLVLDDAVSPALAKIERQFAAFDAMTAGRDGLAGFARLPPPAMPVLPAVMPAVDVPLPVGAPVPPVARPEGAAPAILAVPPLPVSAAPVVVAPAVLAGAAPLVAAALPPVTPMLRPPVVQPQAPVAAPVSLDFALFAPRQAAPALVLPALAPPPPMLQPEITAMTFAPLPEAPMAGPVAPGARQEMQVSATTVARSAEAAAVASPASAVPQLAAGGTLQLSGDVNLDGRRVGRWMSEEFTLMAEGPQAGTTFFDPRAGAAWPGTMQGG